jgi:hypothetical protein
VEPTAIYFNPKLDTVHIADECGSNYLNLIGSTQRVNEETVRSIRMLVLGSRRSQHGLMQCFADTLPAFESLETLWSSKEMRNRFRRTWRTDCSRLSVGSYCRRTASKGGCLR